MDRKRFLLSLAALPIAARAMQLNDFKNITENFKPSERQPVLFLGHGSPMNAIEENEFVAQFRRSVTRSRSTKQSFAFRHIGKQWVHM